MFFGCCLARSKCFGLCGYKGVKGEGRQAEEAEPIQVERVWECVCGEEAGHFAPPLRHRSCSAVKYEAQKSDENLVRNSQPLLPMPPSSSAAAAAVAAAAAKSDSMLPPPPPPSPPSRLSVAATGGNGCLI